MRIGLVLPPGREAEAAELADRHGLFGVLVEAPPGVETLVAAEVAALTRYVRVVVRLPLGSHPVGVAEDIAVLDNLSGGRTVVLADTGDLDPAGALEDVHVLRRCWASRPVQHRGARWHVPAGLDGNDAPGAVEVTPKPAQVEIPVWLAGAAATEVAARAGLPVLASSHEECGLGEYVQPAVAGVPTAVDAGREAVLAWARAGATHLLARVPAEGLAEAVGRIARYLVPEVAMPAFPRVIAESAAPRPWTGTESSS